MQTKVNNNSSKGIAEHAEPADSNVDNSRELFKKYADILIIKKFETAVSMLMFLNDAMEWVKHFKDDSNNRYDPHLMLHMMMEEIAIPWAESKSKTEALEKISKGLSEVNGFYDHDEYYHEAMIIIKYFAESNKDGVWTDNMYPTRCILQLISLIDLAYFFRDVDKAKEAKELVA